MDNDEDNNAAAVAHQDDNGVPATGRITRKPHPNYYDFRFLALVSFSLIVLKLYLLSPLLLTSIGSIEIPFIRITQLITFTLHLHQLEEMESC